MAGEQVGGYEKSECNKFIRNRYLQAAGTPVPPSRTFTFQQLVRLPSAMRLQEEKDSRPSTAAVADCCYCRWQSFGHLSGIPE